MVYEYVYSYSCCCNMVFNNVILYYVMLLQYCVASCCIALYCIVVLRLSIVLYIYYIILYYVVLYAILVVSYAYSIYIYIYTYTYIYIYTWYLIIYEYDYIIYSIVYPHDLPFFLPSAGQAFQVNTKERIVGWYSTGPKIKPSDLSIHELYRRWALTFFEHQRCKIMGKSWGNHGKIMGKS